MSSVFYKNIARKNLPIVINGTFDIITLDQSKTFGKLTSMFTITNPSGKNGYTNTFHEAVLLASWIGGGYVWEVGANQCVGKGWIDACENCCYEVFTKPKVWPYPLNVSTTYYSKHRA